MSLDIRAGDKLILLGIEYPILWCGTWEESRRTATMKRMCSKTASTKRASTSGAKRGDPVTQIAGLKCLPLDPISTNSRDMIVRTMPTAPTDLLETIVDGGDTFYHLIVEKARV